MKTPPAEQTSPLLRIWLPILALVLLYATHWYSYLLFHTLAELFSICVAVSLFIIAWNSRKYLASQYLLFIGIAYLFIALLDTLHTVGYTGMQVFHDYDFYGNQLWIAGRFVESVTLLAAFWFMKSRKVRPALVVLAYAIITALLILSIYVVKVFPVCYIKDVGQTSFKIFSEYVIIALLGLVLVQLHRHRKAFTRRIYRYLLWSVVFTILSELAFAFYIDNYGLSNLVGHYCKIFSFFLIYKALVQKGIREPYDLIFRELQQKEQRLLETNRTLHRFLGIIGHDLRNHIGGISELSALTLADVSDMNDEKCIALKVNLEHIAASADRTYGLLENLLQWANSQSGRMACTPKPVSVRAVVYEVLSLLYHKAAYKDITLCDDKVEDHLVLADRNMLLTVLRNLVANAIKFTPRGGEIHLIVKEDGDMVSFCLQDSGVGMTSDQLDGVLKLDKKQSTQGTEGEQGSGLGLVLCCEFLSRHGSQLHMQSEQGAGTRACFALPIAHKPFD